MDGVTFNLWNRSNSHKERCIHLSYYLGQYRPSVIYKDLGSISIIFQDSNPLTNSPKGGEEPYVGLLYDRWKHARLSISYHQYVGTEEPKVPGWLDQHQTCKTNQILMRIGVSKLLFGSV